MRDFIFAGLLVIGALAAVIAPVYALYYLSESSACYTLHELTGVETNMSGSLGCMVKYQGAWVTREVMTEHKQEVTVK